MMLMKQSTGLMLDPIRMIAVMVGVNSPIVGRIEHFGLLLVKLPDALKALPKNETWGWLFELHVKGEAPRHKVILTKPI